jgi:hypothetical protein
LLNAHEALRDTCVGRSRHQGIPIWEEAQQRIWYV